MKYRPFLTLCAMAALLLIASCGEKEKEFDATGTFESTETTVYAEQSGKLINFGVKEGDEISAGQEIGLIDTTQIWLKIKQQKAARDVYSTQKPDLEKQIAATRQQLDKARREQKRYSELVRDGAVPSKMLDDATSQVKVLQKQLEAQVSSLSTQTKSLDKQMAATDAQADLLYDQLRKCHILSPANGIVLEKYAEQGEFATMSKPLLKIADTKKMFIRAYVTSTQLKSIKVGQQVKVFADYGDKQKKEYKGKVTWIANNSEFTPKTILTDDERADLVYAIKVAVDNDGYIKIGMYGEVKF